jgi:hypothetical protein
MYHSCKSEILVECKIEATADVRNDVEHHQVKFSKCDQ